MTSPTPFPTRSATSLDPRSQRTRTALFEAFKGLVLERTYPQLRVEDILERAEVSRSTFYQHFDGKDDLLTQSMDPLLRVLATSNEEEKLRLPHVLGHFWDNRQFAEAIFAGPAGAAVIEHLALLHEGVPTATVPRPQRRLAARAAAHGQIGVLLDWLTGRVRGEVGALAHTLSSLRPR